MIHVAKCTTCTNARCNPCAIPPIYLHVATCYTKARSNETRRAAGREGKKMKKMTKAQEIFQATRFECGKSMKAWGYEVNPDGRAVGFNFVCTDKAVSTRTLNNMENILRSERTTLGLSLKYGVIDESKFDFRNKELDMVESTIHNTRKAISQ